mgnify:CR=1 FL=1
MTLTEKFSDYKNRPTELVDRFVREMGRGALHTVPRLRKIERITPTQIVLDSGTKLDFDGREIKKHERFQAFNGSDFVLLTESGLAETRREIRDAEDKYRLEVWLKETKFSVHQLRTMKNSVDAMKGGGK